MTSGQAPGRPGQRWLLEHAWLGASQGSPDGPVGPDGTVGAEGAAPSAGVRRDVLVEVHEGRFVRVVPEAPEAERAGAERVPGLTVPGFANAHSHAFHRALRGHTQAERGTFWTWRDRMYDVAARLTPQTYHRLARAVFGEMVAAGWTSVGEFHYLHHDPHGQRYPAHAMEEALLAAAAEAGIRITLLDTLYLSSGFGEAPRGAQVRYCDGSHEAWRERVEELADRMWAHPHARLGVALHSVRAVDPAGIAAVARCAEDHDWVVHAHLSEQVAENRDCVAAHGLTPTQLLAEHGALTARTSLVHATHLTPSDIALIGGAGAWACFCPTTERDLGDGIGPSRELVAAGARLTLGSDSHAVVDPFEEMRAVEMNQRLAAQSRGHWSAIELLAAATHEGHRSLGWDDAGLLAVGHRADLVTLDLASPRTAGAGAAAETAVFAATSGDVNRVVVDGRVVHERDDSEHLGRELAEEIEGLGKE